MSVDFPGSANQFAHFLVRCVARGSNGRRNRMLGKAEFVSGFNLIANLSSVFQKNALRNLQIKSLSLSFHPNRGAGRDRHERGMECDGRDHVAWRAIWLRTAKTRGPDAPWLASSLQIANSNPQATVTKTVWTPGRARSSLLTPLRRECR